MQKSRIIKLVWVPVVLAAFICLGVFLSTSQQNNVDNKFRKKIDEKLAIAHQQATAKVVYQATASAVYEQQLQLTPSPPNYQLKYGLYEATLTWTNKVDQSLYTEKIDLTWVRLYRNGTYRTSQTAKGKVEGRYSYDPKTVHITFKNRYKDGNYKDRNYTEGANFIWNNLEAIYYEDEGRLQQFSWAVAGITDGMYGEIRCKWKKP